MSPRRRRLRKPAFRSPVDDKPEATSSRVRRPVRPGSVQRQKRALDDKAEGSKVKKSKNSPAVPSHDTKAEEPKSRRVHKCCYIFTPYDGRRARGTKAVEPNIATSPHEVAVPSFEHLDLEEDFPDETVPVPSFLSKIYRNDYPTDGSDEKREVTPRRTYTFIRDDSDFDWDYSLPKDCCIDIPGVVV